MDIIITKNPGQKIVPDQEDLADVKKVFGKMTASDSYRALSNEARVRVVNQRVVNHCGETLIQHCSHISNEYSRLMRAMRSAHPDIPAPTAVSSQDRNANEGIDSKARGMRI